MFALRGNIKVDGTRGSIVLQIGEAVTVDIKELVDNDHGCSAHWASFIEDTVPGVLSAEHSALSYQPG